MKLKALEETKSFYELKLNNGNLTERKRNDYLKALKIIEKFIEEEKNKEGKKNVNIR